MTTINKKNFEIDKIQSLCDLDLLLKIRFRLLIVWCLAIQIKRKYVSHFQ